MYYIWSVILTLILFIIIQYVEKNKAIENNIDYNLFNINNLLIFVFLYIICTIIFYYLFSFTSLNNILSFTKQDDMTNINLGDKLDPTVLNKINEDFHTGFEIK